MPIYAYKCESCGFAKDVLQKMSDAVLSTCPQCNAPSFKKQLTAAGFQLKGSGWYVTDFRGGNNAPAAAKPDDAKAASSSEGSSPAADAGSSAGSAAAAPAATSVPAAPASSAPAGDSKSSTGSASAKSS
ncbi:MAG: putative regulatory protein FmdB family [Polaromonas sp.]|jgi:putative FmdB family regulatory protein|nr:putative regulatory protein FmdB family [Polaromonas sp.]